MSSASQSDVETVTEEEMESDKEDEDGIFIRVPPMSQGSVDMLSDKPQLRFMYKTDALSESEKAWFQNNIKKLEQNSAADEPDTSVMNGSSYGFTRQVSNNILNQAGAGFKEMPTDAFGQLKFENEDMISWYVRMAVSMETSNLEHLMVDKFKLVNECKTLQIHCIDYEELPETYEKYIQPRTCYRTRVGMRRPLSSLYELETVPTKTLSKKLMKDIRSICKRTGGLVMTWSGLKVGPGSAIHGALKQLHSAFKYGEDFQSSLATVASPLWSAFPPHIQDLFKKQGDRVLISSRDVEEAEWGNVSPYASHYLQLDMGHQELPNSKDFQRCYRHFQYRLLTAMGSKEEKLETPVVCMLFNGGHDALKMVKFALDHEIPLIVVKGSGGFADVIADVYMMAEVDVRKKREPETGKAVVKAFKLPGRAGDYYMQDKVTRNLLLKEIFKKLDKLTVYDPTINVQSLDAAVFEALLKNGKDHKINYLMHVMKSLKSSFSHSISVTESSPSFIDSENIQMNFFVEAVKQNSKDVVKSFLNTLQLSFTQFHMGRVLRMYTTDSNKQVKMINIRRRLQESLKKLPMFPLHCAGENCSRCDVDTRSKSTESELEVQRTCLHPMQEMFLWCLHDHKIDLAVIFWEKCNDKIAAALFAHALLKSKAKEQSDRDVKWQMNEDADRFQELAILTLKSCQEMNEILTESLLTKPCDWWGGVSVLQLAIMTSNKSFISQTACKNILTRIWKGEPLTDSEPIIKSRFVIKEETIQPWWGSFPSCLQTPRVSYAFSLVLQIIFLMLFSYVLLFDSGKKLTPCFIAVIVWVMDIAAEESRQMLVSDPDIDEDHAHSQECHWLRRRCRNYIHQTWNRLDVATVGVFLLGMIVFFDQEVVHIIGRILLSVDIFLFFIRTFQMLMVFEELGLMLIMAGKMIKDTVNFMIILLVVVLAYAVMSEAVLYPESDLTLERLFHVPRKAYWQVFGEVSLEEIEISDEASCSVVNDSKHFGGDIPHCPTHYGRYVASIMLGVYIMITNVLLLNLLIARFNKTFDKVHDDACEYQSWHRCEIITEFYHRSTLIPPLNMVNATIKLCKYVCYKMCFACKGCCKKTSCHRQNGTTSEQEPLTPRVRATRSTDGCVIKVTWDDSVKSRDNSGNEEPYSVNLSVYNKNMEFIHKEEYKVARNRKYKYQTFTFWDLKPSSTYAVTVNEKETNLLQLESPALRPEDLADIQKFEDKQANWACRQKVEATKLTEKVIKMATKLLEESKELDRKMTKLSDEVKAEGTERVSLVEKEAKERKKNSKNIVEIGNYMAKNFKMLFKRVDEQGEQFKKEAQGLRDKLAKCNEDKVAADQEASQKVESLKSEVEKLTRQLKSTQEEAEEAKMQAKVLAAEKVMAEEQQMTAEKNCAEAQRNCITAERSERDLQKHLLEAKEEIIRCHQQILEVVQKSTNNSLSPQYEQQ
ncbi:transient receptor potential cation channel subfamily M member 4-like isoform X2 [Pomacea canaliculata]|uniref:transient receptor potential cation channel subfamily M member 4-like isoform X2 n=1 Tax=Pomacea canaliculata TaxID=400727 RepID=UPI000D72535D|nr:transient receptor potential cation channel subfamily M member 4-like isoform X2 [Pomacea canaliculata]